ncbi:MAG TPA: hypothetical protein VIZ66_09210 [Sphingomicrobium sp.]
MGQRQVSKDRILRDRAQLLGALRDHRRGRTAHLTEPELAHLAENIERRLAELEKRLAAMDEA